jgi:hypothetical protein
MEAKKHMPLAVVTQTEPAALQHVSCALHKNTSLACGTLAKQSRLRIITRHAQRSRRQARCSLYYDTLVAGEK